LDSLIAETSARWKQQLHDSLRSSSSSHLCARLQPEASSLSSSLADAAAPTLSESPQRMVIITDREPHESTEQELLQRRILSQQRREILFLRAQLVAATSKASAPTASSVPPTHIVLLTTAHGAADDDLIADDDLTLDL
jgi:hypothetical protein